MKNTLYNLIFSVEIYRIQTDSKNFIMNINNPLQLLTNKNSILYFKTPSKKSSFISIKKYLLTADIFKQNNIEVPSELTDVYVINFFGSNIFSTKFIDSFIDDMFPINKQTFKSMFFLSNIIRYINKYNPLTFECFYKFEIDIISNKLKKKGVFIL